MQFNFLSCVLLQLQSNQRAEQSLYWSLLPTDLFDQQTSARQILYLAHLQQDSSLAHFCNVTSLRPLRFSSTAPSWVYGTKWNPVLWKTARDCWSIVSGTVESSTKLSWIESVQQDPWNVETVPSTCITHCKGIVHARRKWLPPASRIENRFWHVGRRRADSPFFRWTGYYHTLFYCRTLSDSMQEAMPLCRDRSGVDSKFVYRTGSCLISILNWTVEMQATLCVWCCGRNGSRENDTSWHISSYVLPEAGIRRHNTGHPSKWHAYSLQNSVWRNHLSSLHVSGYTRTVLLFFCKHVDQCSF